MIRPFLSYLAAPLLGRLGAAVVHAAQQALDDADAAHLNEARAIGERNEARRMHGDLLGKVGEMLVHVARADEEVMTLSAEVDLLRIVESNGHADDEVHTFTAQALEETKAELDAHRKASAAHVAEINTLRARVRELETIEDWNADAARVEAKPAECAWCLGVATWMDCHIDECGVDCVALCRGCNYDDAITAKMIGSRVALRARCCATRLTSPDPLAVVCTLGCGADVGEECHPGRE